MNSQIQSSLSWRRLDTLPTTSSSLLKIGIIEKRGHIYLKVPPSFPVWVNGRRVRGRTVITAGDILQVFKERWLLEDVDGKYVFNLQNLPPIAKGRVNIWFPLKERISLIGSGPECDILLPGLGVPEIAARLERKSDATWRLIPMGGKEDIQINKKSTENEQVLYFGDKISIGGYEFLYRGVGLLWSGENAPDGWHGTAVEVERGGRKILEKVSFEVFAGEVMVVIGRS
ncbi:MAG: hypothetical protein NZL93_07125, partial [Chthoniobacterales bacterium]|nr:hypothetical protein [Chthoniobacterales bacterium]